MISIKISSLSEGVHNFSFDEPVEKIDLTDPFFGNFTAEVELEKLHHQLVTNVDLSVNIRFECDRCGKETENKFVTDYKMVYLFGVPKEEDDSMNVSYLPLEADRINITNDLHDYAILAMPMKQLCSEDCKGLCYNCGKDLNIEECDCKKEDIDDRWLPLLDLKNKLKNK